MLNHRKQLKQKPVNDYKFDEKEDLILPETIFGELKFIIFMLKYIWKHPEKREQELFNLKRQIKIYIKWLKNR